MQRDLRRFYSDTNGMWLFDFLAPPYCVFCAAPLPGNSGSVCRGCNADLPWAQTPLSPRPGALHSCISMLEYEFPVDAAIKAMKFKRKLYYAAAFSEVLCTALPLLPVDLDAILPVPLHWRRKLFRGFNQATEIATPLAKCMGLPILRNVRRQKATPFQSGLRAPERARNLDGAFVISAEVPKHHVLIVDDVLTTGATVAQLAKLLLNSGVGEVSALTVARAN